MEVKKGNIIEIFTNLTKVNNKIENLSDDFYLCPITGQDIEVLEKKVSCPAIQETGECRASKSNLSGCSVYVGANSAYIQSAQSQAKCTPVLNTLREILKISRHYP